MGSGHYKGLLWRSIAPFPTKREELACLRVQGRARGCAADGGAGDVGLGFRV